MNCVRTYLLFLGTLVPFFASANPVNDIVLNLDSDNRYFNFFIEIPAGTNQKWEVDAETGRLIWEEKHGKKRVVKFLPYPGNYGFLPQTVGGDNDPIDVIDMDASTDRGVVKKIRIIGGMNFQDGGDEDVKLIGISDTSVFADYEGIEDLLLSKSEAILILRDWFESYKKPGKMIFHGFLSREEALKVVIEGHKRWLELNK